MIKIWDWEISWRRETTQWHDEAFEHVWEYIFRIEYVSPREKMHRESLLEIRERERLEKLQDL